MNTRRLLSPKNVRFPQELDTALEELALRYRVTKSDLIRQALATQVKVWEREGITLVAFNVKTAPSAVLESKPKSAVTAHLITR